MPKTAEKAARQKYRTPDKEYRELHLQFGFTIDAAAERFSSKCTFYFGPDHRIPRYRDALEVDWIGAARHFGVKPIFFCNPPYKRIMPWCDKAQETADNGGRVVLLIPPSPCSQWWHKHIVPILTPGYTGPNRVIWLKQRIQFITPEGVKPGKGGNDRDSILVIFNPKKAAF